MVRHVKLVTQAAIAIYIPGARDGDIESTLKHIKHCLFYLRDIASGTSGLKNMQTKRSISPILPSLQQLPVKSREECKIFLLTYKVLNGQTTSRLKELTVPYYQTRTLHSQSVGLLVIPIVCKSRIGDRAFSYHAPLPWNHFPISVWEADMFKSRLKTFLFLIELIVRLL